MNEKIPTWLKELKYKIRDYAEHYGLNISRGENLDNEIIFEILFFKEMNRIAAKGGIPKRYPHWKWAMEGEVLEKLYSYGLQKIYEMVINNRPYYGYLLEANNPVDQKLVMAHVMGHVDFFRTNYCFSAFSSKNLVDEMANHGLRVSQYCDKYGEEKVIAFIDVCLSLENLIDIHSSVFKKNEEYSSLKTEYEEKHPTRFFQDNKRWKEYMDDFLNPPEILEKEKISIEAEKEALKKVQSGQKIPENPTQDILLFLIEYAPLEPWQRDILSIIRNEAYYFAPQAKTKIMNEGWAAYWHSKILTGNDRLDKYRSQSALPPLLVDSEIIDYADHHSGTMGIQPSKINPYKLGLELFKHIEDRWNKGKFGKDWEDCLLNGSYEDQLNWDRNLGLGREKIFEVRKLYSDVTFIDEFLDDEFIREQKMFLYLFHKERQQYEIASRKSQYIKESLLFSLANSGNPYIYIIDANYKNRGELHLFHEPVAIDLHKSKVIDLRYDHMMEVIKQIYEVWQRPVHLATQINEIKKLISFDGKEYKSINI